MLKFPSIPPVLLLHRLWPVFFRFIVASFRTNISVSANNFVYGNNVILTTSVNETSCGSGFVSYFDGSDFIGNGTKACGYSYTWISPSVGIHSLVAFYTAGSSSVSSLSSPLNLTVLNGTIVLMRSKHNHFCWCPYFS